MGRQKSAPKKHNTYSDSWYQQPLNYIPVRKRKNKRKIEKRTFYNLKKPSQANKQFHLGPLCIGNTSNIFPEQWNLCKVAFIVTDDEQHLLLDLDSTSVIVKVLIEVSFIKDIVTSHIFAINVFNDNGDVYFDLYFINLPLPKFYKKIGSCIQSVLSILFNVSISEDSDDEVEESDLSSTHAISQLYKSIKNVRDRELNLGTSDVQHPKLKPKLRPYQADAVRWMLYREKSVHEDDDVLHPLYTVIKLKSGLNIYFDKYSGYIEVNRPLIENSSRGGILADEMGLGKTVEVLACILLHPKPLDKQDHSCCVNLEEDPDLEKSPTVDKLTRRRRMTPHVKETESQTVDKCKRLKVPNDWVKGSSRPKSDLYVALEMWYKNCLADVDVNRKNIPKETYVQCICGKDYEEGAVVCNDCGKLQHGNCLGYKKKFGVYRCPQCWMNQPLLECGATLIVSPVSLRTQWCKEICKHIKGHFKVLQYGGSSLTPIYPTQLMNYDVVITTYNVLQAELRLTETEKVISFRHQRRYSPPGSPLTRVKWWRLCLDEAQTVEAPTSMVSAMAKKLDAHFRWAVTGTPISKEISDLYGLVDYLQIEPYNDKFTWQNILYDPYIKGQTEPMITFLSRVLWRSSKDEVINQINIPKQTVVEHWLDFSAVEQYFYRCEHRSSCVSFLEKANFFDPNIPLQTLDKSSMKNVLAPLLSLRQVCTYPNSLRTRYLATKKPVNSMKELLEALIIKNTTESEEYLRIVLSALNGLAGIFLLLQNPEAAIDAYRQVLQLYTRFMEEEDVAKLNVDKLQIIHTMHNLAEVLEIYPLENARTLRDETLRKDCMEIEHKYIEKFINQSMTALQDSLLISASVEKLQNSFIFKPGTWYSDMLDWIYIHDHNQELYTRINNAHDSANVECTVNFRNERALIYALASWDETISELRESTIEVINNLYSHCPDDEFKIIISQELVQNATDCHLRPQKKAKNKRKCPVCVANDHLKAYELKLFAMTKRTTTFEDMSLKGSWKPTTEELVLKSVLALGRSKSANNDLIKDGEIHINLLDTIKKEFKEVRKLWTFLDQQICAQDELDMCKIRLRVRQANDEDKEQKKLKPILKNLTYTVENKLETIHVLDEHELDYQRALLQGEEKRNLALLEKNLGIRSYLETLHKQQYEGQSPDPCPICKNPLEHQWSIISCGHSYCLECIQLLIEQTRGHHIQCSVCRAYHLVTEISYIKQGEQKDDPETMNIKGSYSSKVEGVIKLILELKAKDPKVKILVFSTWIPVLNYLGTAMTNNDISIELITTGNLEKQIEKFKDPENNITALLLPIHLGGKGLNLIEATHVILTEPLLNSGDELQAIGRVHRIGQTKPTVVHKFFIKNTIEESIQKATSTNAQNWEKNKVTLRQLMDLFIVEENPANETIETEQNVTSE